MGKEGIIAEHPTLKLKYIDPEMARTAQELKMALESDHKNQKDEHDDVTAQSQVDSSQQKNPSSDLKETEIEEVR
jgi:hypothetical protein